MAGQTTLDGLSFRRYVAGREHTLGWGIAAVGLGLAPFALSEFWVRIFILANIFALFTLSWNALSGRTDYISFGHSFFIGIGGYTAAILTTQLGLPVYVGIVAALVLSIIAGALILLPSLRLKGVYFTFLSLLLPILAKRLAIVFSDVTGGARGIIGVPPLIESLLGNYYLSLGLMLTVAYTLWRLWRSDLGTVFSMISQSEELVANSGINPMKFKFVAFVTSAFIGGLGGVFKVHYMGTVTIDAVLFLPLSINIVIAAIIGGRGSTVGAVVGAYFFVVFNAYFRPFADTAIRLLAFYIVGLAFILFLSKGIVPTVTDWLSGAVDVTKWRIEEGSESG